MEERAMEYRDLGRTGLQVSAIGFGSGNIGGLMVRGEHAEQRAAVAAAIEAGVSYFDTAAQYGDGRSEENLGKVLRELHARVYVGTKIRLQPDQIADARNVVRHLLQDGLRRLGRYGVEICTLHNPITRTRGSARGSLGVDDVLGPVGEAMRALRESGLTRFVGFTGLGDTTAIRRVVQEAGFDTMQCYYNALNPSAGYPGSPAGETQDFDGLIDQAAGAGMGVFAIRIMAAGALAAAPARHPVAGDPGSVLAAGSEYPRDLARAERLAPLAAELGLEGPLELALRFALAKPGISSALIGPSDQQQVSECLRWAERGPLPADAVERVLAVARGAA
jgi:L-galactose dehydrogenase/L-glyceraldehyde 3-phosphate reductase